MSDLKERVLQFIMLELPGQPPMMHMGTSYLVNDLWARVQKLEAQHTQTIAEAAEIEACLRADVARLLKSSEALEERNAQLEDALRWIRPIPVQLIKGIPIRDLDEVLSGIDKLLEGK